MRTLSSVVVVVVVVVVVLPPLTDFVLWPIPTEK
jgi:hypothetical protein